MKYIGQTSKTLEKRVSQHKYSIRTGQESNALFVHIKNTDHCIDLENARKIIKCPNTIERNIIESAIIQYNQGTLLNNHIGLYNLDQIAIENIYKNYIG